MTGNAQKVPFAASLSEYTRRAIDQAIKSTGRGLPASVVSVQAGRGVVEVKFELTNTGYNLPNVTIPLFGPEWIRYPLTAGTKGVVIPFDTSIGNMSGLGPQSANLGRVANLSSLVFLPVGNSSFADPGEPDRLVLYGPDGAVLRSANKDFIVRVTETEIDIQKNDGTISFKVTGTKIAMKGLVEIDGSVQINGSITAIGGGTYAGNFETSGNVIAGKGGPDQVGLQTHTHGYIRPNSGGVGATSNPPTAGS